MKPILLVFLIASFLGQGSAQDYQSKIFSLPIHNAKLLKAQAPTNMILALLRGSGTGDCASDPETYQLQTNEFFDISELSKMQGRFIADAAARGFKYTHINTSHQTQPAGEYTFTLFKLTGSQGSLFGHAIQFKGKVTTLAPDVTTFGATTVLTICRAK